LSFDEFFYKENFSTSTLKEETLRQILAFQNMKHFSDLNIAFAQWVVLPFFGLDNNCAHFLKKIHLILKRIDLGLKLNNYLGEF